MLFESAIQPKLPGWIRSDGTGMSPNHPKSGHGSYNRHAFFPSPDGMSQPIFPSVAELAKADS